MGGFLWAFSHLCHFFDNVILNNFGNHECVNILFDGFVSDIWIKLGQVFEVDSSLMHDILEFDSVCENNIMRWKLFCQYFHILVDRFQGILQSFDIISVGFRWHSSLHKLIYVVKDVFRPQKASSLVLFYFDWKVFDQLVDVNKPFVFRLIHFC